MVLNKILPFQKNHFAVKMVAKEWCICLTLCLHYEVPEARPPKNVVWFWESYYCSYLGSVKY